MRRRPEGEEELRAARVAAGVGHAQRAREMSPVILLVTLAIDGVARSAGAVPLRVASLSHEILQDAMEPQPVVEALAILAFHEADEVADRIGRLVLEQLDHNVAFGGLELHARQVGLGRFGLANLLFLLPTLLVARHGSCNLPAV